MIPRNIKMVSPNIVTNPKAPCDQNLCIGCTTKTLKVMNVGMEISGKEDWTWAIKDCSLASVAIANAKAEISAATLWLYRQ
jgi:hypothetical protein